MEDIKTNINEIIISVDLEDNIKANPEFENILYESLENSPNLTSNIRQSDQLSNNDNIVKVILNLCCVIILIILIGPLTISSLYFAYTDNSCVHENAGQLEVNLFTYLAVDGIIGGAVIILLSVLICYNGTEGYVNLMSGCLSIFISYTSILFQIAWTIIGSVIFWKLIDNKTCDKGIYNYVFTLLIIKIVSLITNILYSRNNKKE